MKDWSLFINAFPVSIDFMRYWMPALSGDEWKVALVIYTSTYSLFRLDARMSVASVAERTGIADPAVRQLLRTLHLRGCIAMGWQDDETFDVLVCDDWLPEAPEVNR